MPTTPLEAPQLMLSSCANDGVLETTPETQFAIQHQLQGRLHLDQPPAVECIYVCDDWPSWYFICDAIHVKCSIIYHPSTAQNLFLAQQYAPSLPLQPGLPSTSDVSNASFLVIQGSLQLFQSLPDYECPRTPTLYLPSLPDGLPAPLRLPSPWISVDVPHADCGGVLAGRFPVVYNPSGWTILVTSLGLSYPRALRHIVNHAAKGFHPASAPPVDPQDHTMMRRVWHIPGTPTVLDWNGLLPRHSPCFTVLCPSVFTTSKWTRRGLTPEELAAAFDVSSAGLKYFAKWPYGQRRRLPFLRSLPARILQRLWHSMRPVNTGGGGSSFSCDIAS